MPDRSRKRPTDMNQLAKSIVDDAVAEDAPESTTEDPIKAAARALGRRGGLKGGPARKKALSPERRKEIAKKAAQTRWAKRPQSEA